MLSSIMAAGGKPATVLGSVLLFVMTGCDSIFGVAAPIDANTSRDDAATIDAAASIDSIDAIDASNPDSDGDGVLDVEDNCPALANADQFDEDGDGFGDLCDGCPHIGTSSNNDADGDKVGDPCDPQPSIASEELVLFDGFHGSTLAPHWTASGAAPWVVTDGHVEVAAVEAAKLALSNTPGNLRITAGFEVISTQNGVGGILFDFATQGSMCGRLDGVTTDSHGMYDFVTGGFVQRAVEQGGASGVNAYVLTTTGPSRRCTATGLDEMDADSADPHVAKVGLAAYNATLRANYIFVIRSIAQ